MQQFNFCHIPTDLLGIENYLYGDEVHTNRIIKCEYGRIEKKVDGYFICHKGSEVTYIDLKGNILK